MNDSEELECTCTKLCTKLGTPLCPLFFFLKLWGGGGLRGGLIEEDGFDTIIYSCSLNV